MQNGGVIGVINTSSFSSASGVWSLSEANNKIADKKWPEIVTGNLTTTNLVLHLDFNNTDCYPGSGTAVTNLVSGQANATLVNGPTFSTSSAGGYIQLDGVNDRITFNPTTSLKPASGETVTRNWWVYVSNGIPTGLSCLDGWDSGSGSPTCYIANGIIYFARAGVANDGGGSSLSANTWVNITHSFKLGTNSVYYINGVLTHTKSFGGTFSYNNNYHVGANLHDNLFLNGRVGVFHYYSRELTQQEITDNFNYYRYRFGV